MTIIGEIVSHDYPSRSRDKFSGSQQRSPTLMSVSQLEHDPFVDSVHFILSYRFAQNGKSLS